MPPAFTSDGLASQTIVAVHVQCLTYEPKYVDLVGLEMEDATHERAATHSISLL